jgi:hypothetical protein
MIRELLQFFGVRIERRQPPGVRRATALDVIGEIFDSDALRQQSDSLYFHRGLAPRRNDFGRAAFNEYLKDGAAPPPRR